MIQQHDEVSWPASPDPSPHLKIARHRRLVLLNLVMALALVTLACVFMGSVTPSATESIARLPTLTPTAEPALALTPASTPQATAPSLPAQTPTAISTPTPYAGGWVFSG